MKKYTIIAGSSCDISDADLKSPAFDFVTVPLTITINGKDWVDEVGLNIKEFVAAMKVNKDKPLTACPSPEAFAEKMRAANENVIVVTISSKLSGTYNSACLAAETVRAEQPKKKIHVHDSLSATGGECVQVLRIAELIENGKFKDFEDLCKQAEEIRKNHRNRFLLQDPGNMVKTGRMSKVAGIVVRVANIKIICGDDGQGEVKKYATAIGIKKALFALAEFPGELVARGVKPEDNPIICINHVLNEEEALQLKSLVEAKWGFTNIKIRQQRGLASFYSNDQGIVMGF